MTASGEAEGELVITSSEGEQKTLYILPGYTRPSEYSQLASYNVRAERRRLSANERPVLTRADQSDATGGVTYCHMTGNAVSSWANYAG